MDTHPWDQRAVTVSIGVAGWSRDLNGPEDLIGQADRAMYQAKQAGRNRVIAATPIDDGRDRHRLAHQDNTSFVIDDTTSRRQEASNAVDRDDVEAGV